VKLDTNHTCHETEYLYNILHAEQR